MVSNKAVSCIRFVPACAVFLLSSPAVAGGGEAPAWIRDVPEPPVPAESYDPRPGVLYVPVEDVMVQPPPCADGTTQPNSAKDCTTVVGGPTTIPAWGTQADRDMLVMGLQAALAPYNVRVTTERPDDYVPYHMLLMSDMDDDTVMSDVCALAPVGCDGLPRNRTALVLGSTMNCMDRDPLAAALYAFGRLSGLEPISSGADPMVTPQDPMNPQTAYEDACNPFVDPNDLMCLSSIHKMYCNDMDGVQNSHQELLGVYGPAPAEPDTTPPTIDSIMPADGSVFTPDDAWVVTATASDDSGYYVARWDWVENIPPGLEDYVCKATNRACPKEFDNAHAVTGQAWDFISIPGGTPAGTYKFRFTVQDMAGNTASQEITVTVEGAGGGSSGGGGSTSGGPTTAGGTTSGGGETTTGIESGGGMEDTGGDGGGCSCRTSADRGALWGLGFLLAAWAARRRRR